MKASSSRIEILEFGNVPPYTEEGERSSQAPHLLQRFDVRRAKCSAAMDEERMLAVIEGCGAGFDSFNQWMHGMLRATQQRQTAASGRSSGHMLGKLRERSAFGGAISSAAAVHPATSLEEDEHEPEVRSLDTRASRNDSA
jgi:hypothetical protein